jgi:tetratricopeptide (TPR) repeat protein
MLLTSLLLAAAAASAALCPAAEELARKGQERFTNAPEKGLTALVEAHRLCPSDGAIAYNLGLAYYRYRAPAEARSVWRAALDQDPEHLKTRAALAWVTLESGEAAAALDLAEQGLGQNPAYAPLVHTRAQALYRLGRYREAYRALRDAPLEGDEVEAWREEARDYAVEQVWRRFRGGERQQALADGLALAREHPDEAAFQRAKERLFDAFIDAAKAPLPVPLPDDAGPGSVVAASSELLDARIAALPPVTDKRDDAYALIVGISRYAHLTGPRYARRDAQNVYRLLVRRGPFRDDSAHVRLRLDGEATLGDLHRDIAWLLGRARRHPDGLALLYFSGHGAPLFAADGETVADGLLVPADASLAALNDRTGISLDWLKGQIKRVRGAQVVSVVDACFSGGGRSVSDRKPSGVYIAPRLLGGAQPLAVAASNQAAEDLDPERQGAFTYFLLEGLLGQADGLAGRKDGWVDLVEAFTYAERHLADLGLPQDPRLAPRVAVRLTRAPGER